MNRPKPAQAPNGTERAVQPRNCGFAVAALITALLVPVPVSVVLGHIGLRRIRRSDGMLLGRGFAITGLVLGYVWLAWWVFFTVAVWATVG